MALAQRAGTIHRAGYLPPLPNFVEIVEISASVDEPNYRLGTVLVIIGG